MVDIVGGLAALGNALGIVKELNQLQGELDRATLRLKIADLTGELASARITMAEAQDEMREKDNQIRKLTENFKAKAELVESRGYMYRKRRDGKPQGRPYCPRCLQEGQLHMTVVSGKEGRPMTCPQCQRDYRHANDYLFEDDVDH